MNGLGANHARALVAAFSEVDKLLGEIETLATPNRSPLARIIDDLSPSQHDEINSHVQYIREQLVHSLAALGIGIRVAGSSAKGPIMTRLSFAEIAIREADPKTLRGYGTISPGVEVTLERTLADLLRSLRAMRRALQVDASKGFGTRLARLEETAVDVAMLGTLEQVVSRRGFVELRGLLDALVEQLESRTFEVAIFGRVSCGKSSLMNAVLGFDVLPVGVTPVTAVPTRIVSGDETLVRISFASDPKEQTLPIAQLESFVSEAQNPANEKRVRRVTVVVSSDRLPRGIALVDTPGVGALATAGARETYTYLPRCDLGVVLLDAAGSLSHDDLRLIQSLRDSAIPSMLVVSKADLVRPSDRDKLADYVSAEVKKATGLDLPLNWVSTVDPTANAREWFAHEIEPLLHRARENAEASSRRKLAQLHESVVASLRALRGHVIVDVEVQSTVEQLAGEAERMLQKHQSRCDDIASDASDLAAPIVRLAMDRFAQAAEPKQTAKDIVRAAMLVTAEDVRNKVTSEIVVARDGLARLLAEMASAVGVEHAAGTFQIDLVTLPVINVPPAVEQFELSAGWMRLTPGKRKFRDQVVRDLGAPLSHALSDFRQALRAWSQLAIDRLSEQFAAASGPLRSRVRATPAKTDRDVEDDLKLLGAKDSETATSIDEQHARETDNAHGEG